MDEAVEQDHAILYPQADSKLIQRAHQKLQRKHDIDSLVTIPLASAGKVFGAITLIGSETSPLDSKTLDICQQIMSLLTPFLVLKREQERGFLARMAGSFGNGLTALFGIRYLKAKLLLTALASLLTVASGGADFRLPVIVRGACRRYHSPR